MARCRTGKIRYRDRIMALIALNETGRGKRDRDERRAYECHHCRGWHLTSQPLRANVKDA